MNNHVASTGYKIASRFYIRRLRRSKKGNFYTIKLRDPFKADGVVPTDSGRKLDLLDDPGRLDN